MTRRALITGAGSGLGNHLATALTAGGWTVTGVGRGDGDDGYGFRYVRADLSDWDTVAALPDLIDGWPDLVVHCAVSYPHHGAGTPEPEDLEAVFRINALAPYLLTRRLLEVRPAGRFWCTVMVNSEAMFGADSNSAPYAASKAAMRVLSAGLADSVRGSASVATLLLGPLASRDKLASIRSIARSHGRTEADVTQAFLRRSNPNLVIDTFIDHDACLRSVLYLYDLGPIGNGMVCRLDGGSSGSLI